MKVITAPAKPWYCLYTDPRCEWRVAGDLFVMGYETLTLYERVKTRHARYERDAKKWLFPRYVFTRFPGAPNSEEHKQGISDAINLRGVHHILGTLAGPWRVEDETVQELVGLLQVNEQGCIPAPIVPIRPKAAPGSVLPIVDGTLAGLFAMIISDGRESLRVWVQDANGRLGQFQATLPAKALGLA